MQNQVVSRDEWLAARLGLLKEEKELTRRSDELARRRQELPWVRVDKEYRFETEEGSVSLADLFQGRSQLLVYHFMFGPDWKAGCPSCSSIADGFDGFVIHLAHHDVTLAAVSRAALPKLKAYKRRMGWSFPWASSLGGDFNFDFGVAYTDGEMASGPQHNLHVNWDHADTPADQFPAHAAVPDPNEMPPKDAVGMSAFALEDGVVYHTYSAYARGMDALWGMYQWLDRAPEGRNDTGPGRWYRLHDEYGAEASG
jgi:predicted dithiol-disulfide oxidoreductase (DUF899 family)